jgi:hypothetical protein
MFSVGKSKLNKVVEPTVKCLVESISVVGGGNDKAVAAELFDEDQESVQEATHFADIAGEVPGVTDTVELVEQIDGSCAD